MIESAEESSKESKRQIWTTRIFAGRNRLASAAAHMASAGSGV